MKRIIVISALLVSLGSFGVRAGDLAGKANSTVLSETAARNSLWRGSSSAAGLAFSPYTIVNTLDLRYDGEFGEYRQIGDGKTSNAVSLNTAGAARLGKFLVTGDFSFRNIFDENSLYNVLQYEVEDNMAYLGLPTVLDAGGIYCSGIYTTESIARKVKETRADGTVVYQDTNNTTNDFEVKSDPTVRRNGAKVPAWNTWIK